MSWSQFSGQSTPPRAGGRLFVAGIVTVLFIAVVAGASLFTVHQTEQVLITQFGRPVRVITDPGLHAKLPFVQNALSFDRRLINYELPPEEVILGDQRRLIVDAFTVFRINDPLKYYQAVGSGEEGIRARQNSFAISALRRVLGNSKLLDVLSADRAHLMSLIRDQVNADMTGFGVSIEDVRIRRADLPKENTQAILSRMKSERDRIAAQLRAGGTEASIKIKADADRDVKVLLANASATADRLRGEGEAEASRIYSQAYEKDPQFFAAWRTMQAYRDALASGQSRLVLTPGNDFLKLLQTPPTPTP